jgi:hypothetical protein
MTAMTHPPMAKWRRTGTFHMDLVDQEGAAGLAAAGRRDGLRRHPVRAQAGRDTRHATLATLQAPGATAKPDLIDPPRATAQRALPTLVARAEQLRITDGSALPLEGRAGTLTVKARAPQEAANLDGGSGLKTDLTPAQAPQERGHDRDQDRASVAHACRTCPTAPLAVCPSFWRLEARTRAQAFVVLLASQILHSLASCWSPWDVTVAEGLPPLTTLCRVAGSPTPAPSSHCLPTPRDAIAPLLPRADITLPKAFSRSGTRVATKKKRQSERLVQ